MSNRTLFTPSVQEDIHAVEDLMRTQADGRHPDLQAALKLLLAAGGKRVRPSITLLIGKMLGAEHPRLITMAAAIELLHTATLVHDDLIDGSLLRRGMPTLNAQWSPGATVLTGDFLFACAAELAAKTESIPVIQLFSHTLSIIVNGEITQLFNSRCRASREDYYQRIYAKTASLFETSAWSAALLSHSDDNVLEAMRRYGYEIGMAFQIVDDILDFTSDQSALGKPVGSDLRQGLVTLPAIYYIEDRPDDPQVHHLLEGNCDQNDVYAQKMVDAIRSSDAIEKSYAEARQYAQRGADSLSLLPPSSERQALEDLAFYFVRRNL